MFLIKQRMLINKTQKGINKIILCGKTGEWILFFVWVIFALTNYRELITLKPHPFIIAQFCKFQSPRQVLQARLECLWGLHSALEALGNNPPQVPSACLAGVRVRAPRVCSLLSAGAPELLEATLAIACFWSLCRRACNTAEILVLRFSPGSPSAASLWLSRLLLLERAHMGVPGNPPPDMKHLQIIYFDISWLVTLTSSSKSIVP